MIVASTLCNFLVSIETRRVDLRIFGKFQNWTGAEQNLDPEYWKRIQNQKETKPVLARKSFSYETIRRTYILE